MACPYILYTPAQTLRSPDYFLDQDSRKWNSQCSSIVVYSSAHVVAIAGLAYASFVRGTFTRLWKDGGRPSAAAQQ